MDEQTPRSWKLGIGLLTALLWLAAIGSAAYWTMRFLDSSKPAPANAREAAVPPPQALNWAALASHFGAEQKAAAVASDIKVLGIVLPPALSKARAVLMVENTKTTVVAEVGREIEDGPLQGAVIERITPREVLLNRSKGNTQSLPVPDAKDAKSSGLITFSGNPASSGNTGNAGTTSSTQVLPSINQGVSGIPPNSMPQATTPQGAAAAAAQAARAAAQNAMEAQQQQMVTPSAQLPPPAPVQEPGVVTTRQFREPRERGK